MDVYTEWNVHDINLAEFLLLQPSTTTTKTGKNLHTHTHNEKPVNSFLSSLHFIVFSVCDMNLKNK